METYAGAVEYSEIGEGPPVVLLHRAGRATEQWRELLPLLSARFRVIAPELFASAPGAVPELEYEAERLRALIDGLGIERLAVIGAGRGGAVAQLLALGGAPVDGMVLLSSELLEDREQELAGWEFPVLILWGEDDPVLPVGRAEKLNDAIPTSTLGILPGCGHDLMDEAAATIGPMIFEYLRARYLKAPHGHGETSGIVTIQLERRPPWVDLAEDERDDWFEIEDKEEERE
jgi:pimeloyl-ACP methyl ester carboxylesterase